MPRSLSLALPLALVLLAAWPAAPARAVITTEEYRRLHGDKPVGETAAESGERTGAPAGTIRTEDGAVFTVPKAQDRPRPEKEDGGKAP